MKRQLIFQDDNKLSYILRDLRQWNPLCQAVLVAYTGLSIGDMTPELWEAIKDGTDTIPQDYKDSLEKQLDSAGVKHPALRRQALAGTEEPLQAFHKAVRALKQFYPSKGFSDSSPVLELQYISFDGKDFIVSNQTQEELLEQYCRVYLNSAEEEELHTQLQTMGKAYNTILKAFEDLGCLHMIKSGVNQFAALNQLFTADEEGKISLRPQVIAMACNYQAAERARQVSQQKRDAAKRAEREKRESGFSSEYPNFLNYRERETKIENQTS